MAETQGTDSTSMVLTQYVGNMAVRVTHEIDHNTEDENFLLEVISMVQDQNDPCSNTQRIVLDRKQLTELIESIDIILQS